MALLWGSLTRGVDVRLPHDRHTGLRNGARLTEVELLERSGPTSGEFMLDDRGRRTGVRVIGDPVLYELTLPLRPGWVSDEHWDVDPDDPMAVAAAKQYAASAEWEAAYVALPQQPNYTVGRYWVLNEDGAFAAYKPKTDPEAPDEPLYKREHGPWADDFGWLPFDFTPYIHDLTYRGDSGWSTRRRPFREPEAYHIEAPAGGQPARVVPRRVGLEASLSFDGGATWEVGLVNVEIDPDRAAVTLAATDPRTIVSARTGRTLVEAYLEGKLRVRVTAVIESDDRVFGVVRQEPWPFFPLPWVEQVDRSAQLKHVVRNAPRNDYWHVWGLTWPDNRDDRDEAERLARRILDEAHVRRAPGMLNFPYLLRPDPTVPWENYAVGDELSRLRTDLFRTDIDLRTGNGPERRGPQVSGLVYRWAREPAEMTTQVLVEDDVYAGVEVAGDREEQ
jgi:hypothetical protein